MQCEDGQCVITGISGIIHVVGGAPDIAVMRIRAFEIEPPDCFSAGVPAAVEDIEDPTSHGPYKMVVEQPGTYWVMVYGDVNGDNPDSPDESDPCTIYPSPVVVVEDELTTGINLTVPSANVPKANSSISGTLALEVEPGPDDVLRVFRSVEKPSPLVPGGAGEVLKDVSLPLEYVIEEVPAGGYYLNARLDIGGNNPTSIGPEDWVGHYPTFDDPQQVFVGEAESVTGIDFAVDKSCSELP